MFPLWGGEIVAEPMQKPPETEKTIGKTTYTVTSHFKLQGSTASQIIKRLINTDTKSGKG